MKTAVEWLYEQMPKKIQPHYKRQLEQAKEIEKEQIGYSEEDMKQFGLYLGDNLKKLKGKSIDELFTTFKQQEQ
jgi:hypothetical protein